MLRRVDLDMVHDAISYNTTNKSQSCVDLDMTPSPATQQTKLSHAWTWTWCMKPSPATYVTSSCHTFNRNACHKLDATPAKCNARHKLSPLLQSKMHAVSWHHPGKVQHTQVDTTPATHQVHVTPATQPMKQVDAIPLPQHMELLQHT